MLDSCGRKWTRQTVKLKNVYYAPSIARNIIRYGKLDETVYSLKYSHGMWVVAERSDIQILFDKTMKHSVFIIETTI